MDILLSILLYLTTPVQEIKNAHVSFEISHMGVLTVEGSFEEIKVTLMRRSEDLWIAKGEIDASTIQTGNSSRDKTILTEQYLNVEVYPNIPFEAEIRKNLENFIIKAELELRGIPLTLNSTLEVDNAKLISKPIIIRRSEIGLDFGAMDTLIGNEIKLILHPQISSVDLFKLEK